MEGLKSLEGMRAKQGPRGRPAGEDVDGSKRRGTPRPQKAKK